MDESAIKGLELLELTDRKSRISRIVVEGYDTCLPEEDVDASLRQHFSSCGDIIHVYVPIDFKTGNLNRFALIYVAGDEEEKALSLNGSDMGGGRILSVKAYPFYEAHLDLELARMRAPINHRNRLVTVTGYDTTLPVEDIKMALTKHFSGFLPAVPEDKRATRSLLFIKEGSLEKALQLSGRSVEGLILQVVKVATTKRIRCGYTVSSWRYRMTEEQKALNYF